MNKVYNNRAWWLILPMLLLVAFSAIIPLMTVVNYSVQDVFDAHTRFFTGTEWFVKMLNDPVLQGALLRQFAFSLTILAIEVPLGIGIALLMPKRGWQASVVLILVTMPLLIPWNVVGSIWQLFTRGDIGLMGWSLRELGYGYNITASPVDAWATIILMDVWHWTPLIALLCYSGLRSIPDAYYQAARIDRASKWSVFRYIQLPKLTNVLVIGVLLRFMHSFMIYAEPFVLTGGGPGSSTTFLSQSLTTMAIGQQDLGPSAAFSLIYFLIILLVTWVFYTAIMNMQKDDNKGA
ncbi:MULTISPECIES: carbohydrate ABC transporter permease [Chromohalobacter]|uniref:Carbohydrate ABC transporter membrane protein 1, CUT1 family n=1 Tax=Chromohalobacter israelensis (strain ATCC BAA-138 / DSM 3043 / CIP 106854 / NCIMB 13768 / 1H11) TaxID=290398 RepID=Q1QVR5_CHRI1|nr:MULTISPECIES: sugar ABC transporter permease [Chromohalobacter]ABE59443.1 carbohydrate ABC transporter membrane protein 1, CUT1 family [Chromohalobacter salexigens DSM 3043]MBZ5874789.1 sugar ABC transporter permease [Chromohalobacter salexigens]MDO0946413.1 sugar ABC transporter permease [Chromohalobacter salexigens]NQY46209.1 sugar ABC transporter permease [Chromohalobacter sp.]NWO56846.1 sugar ABC transporter permease [Chromohalobacter salexigens]